MATANRPYGKVFKGHTIPYGTLVGASYELKQAYYNYGYLHDEDMPELPCHSYAQDECNDPEEEAHKKNIAVVVNEVLDSLSPRAKKVMCLRFGIGLTQDYTLEEVGLRFDVTRERIRQIEIKALRDLRHPFRSDKLRELLGIYQTTAQKKAEEELARTQWARERAKAEERRKAADEARLAQINNEFKVRRETAEMVAKADRELRQKWEDVKPMVTDADWVAHLKTEHPAMYQELKYLVGDIWGKNARQVWNLYAKEKL
jgi:hypothetical protein